MRHLELSATEREDLLDLRDRGAKAYLRERAALLLKVADGTPAAAVAREGLLRRRRPDTVYLWLDRFAAEGIGGLAVRRGRGRQPAFPPQAADGGEATERLVHLIRRAPPLLGIAHARWTLADVRQVAPDLAPASPSGVWRMLARLGLSWQRARQHVRSPDPDYQAKRAWVARLHAEVVAAGDRLVLVYQDERTVGRQPTLAQAWATQGDQPRAERSWRSDTLTRIAATLDARTGRVIFRRASRLSLDQLVACSQQVCAGFPAAERIYVVQDNWPVHCHPDLLVALQPQQPPFPWYRAANWPAQPSPAARRRWGSLHLPIQLVPLPTYASWLNPIEKLWRKLRQECTHLHRLADHLDDLRHQLDTFLGQFAYGSLDLLRYVGLLVPG